MNLLDRNVQYTNGLDKFALLEFEIHSETIIRNYPKIVESKKKIGKRKRETKYRILSTFSIKAWNEFTDLNKKLHTFFHCQGCTKNENFD